MNPEVQCCIHKGPPIIPILSWINPIPHISLRSILILSSHLCLGLPTKSCQIPGPCVKFLNEDGFYNLKLLASCQTPKLEDYSWSTVHDCLFIIFAAILHIWRPTSPSATQGTCHAVVLKVKITFSFTVILFNKTCKNFS